MLAKNVKKRKQDGYEAAMKMVDFRLPFFSKGK
jgi:hypothetical protein